MTTNSREPALTAALNLQRLLVDVRQQAFDAGIETAALRVNVVFDAQPGRAGGFERLDRTGWR